MVLEGVPGPDGFFFFHRYQGGVKEDLSKLMIYFFVGKVKLHCLNYSWVILLPKKDNPQSIGDYRPSSLSNCARTCENN